MHRFSNDREALDFISSRIADEAGRDGIALSEVERKMLYFSETAWTLPDIWDVSDEFDRNYNQAVYEKKISRLITNAISRARKRQPEEYEAWAEAIRDLRKEDRYLLVMLGQARLDPKLRRSSSSRSLRRLQVTVIAVGALFVGMIWLINKRFPEANLPADARGRLDFAFWLAMLCFSLLYIILWPIGRRFPGWAKRMLDWTFGAPKAHRHRASA